MGPFSGVLFLVGVIMFNVGRNRNNDDLFSGHSLYGDWNLTPEQKRIKSMITGIVFIIAAVVMWVYIAVKGEPVDIPDYSSMMSKNSSQ